MYVHKLFVKIGGNENNAQFSKQRGKLPYFFENKGNYPVIPIYGLQEANTRKHKICGKIAQTKPEPFPI